MMVNSAIATLIEKLPGDIGFLFSCPETGEMYEHNADLPLIAASVIKVPIMVEAFRQMHEGLLDGSRKVVIRAEDKLPSCGALTYMHDGLEVTVYDLITLMIILSDNTATNIMIDILGMEEINSTMQAVGLTGSRLNRKLFRPELSRQGIENYVTARDMARLFAMMLDGTLVSPEASKEMLRILGDQRLNGKIPFFLHPKDIDVAHKTGEDDGITHDVGVVYDEKPFIMCFLSNKTDTPAAIRAMQDIALMLVERK